MSKISTQTRQELVKAIRRAVPGGFDGRQGSNPRRVHRTHGLPSQARDSRPMGLDRNPAAAIIASRLYDEAVRQALVVLWEASDRICGKRLKPCSSSCFQPSNAMGTCSLDGGVRERLLTVSAATIDRLLAGARASAGGRRTRTRTRRFGAHSGSHVLRLERAGAWLHGGRPRRALRREHGGQLRPHARAYRHRQPAGPSAWPFLFVRAAGRRTTS